MVPVVMHDGDPDQGHQKRQGSQRRRHLMRWKEAETEGRKAISANPKPVLFEVPWQLLL